MDGCRVARLATLRTAALGVALCIAAPCLAPADASDHGIEVAAAKARAEQDFVNADIDLDGVLSAEEFQILMRASARRPASIGHTGGLMRRIVDRLGAEFADPRKAPQRELTPAQVQSLRERLAEFDDDGDGVLTFDEYAATTPDYDAMDRNGDGWITDAELRIWNRSLGRDRQLPSEVQVTPPPPR